MNSDQKYLFNNRHTGEVLALSKIGGSLLGKDWSEIKPAINAKGERVLRMELNGATVDISENTGSKVVIDGISDAS